LLGQWGDACCPSPRQSFHFPNTQRPTEINLSLEIQISLDCRGEKQAGCKGGEGDVKGIWRRREALEQPQWYGNGVKWQNGP